MKLALIAFVALALCLSSQAQILIEEKIVNGGETFIGQSHNLIDPELAGVAYFQLNFARLSGALMLCQVGVDSFLPSVGWRSGMAVAFQDCRSSGTVSTTSTLIADKIRFNVGAVGSGSVIVQLFGCLAPCGFNSSGFVSLTPTSNQIITGTYPLTISSPSGRPTLAFDTTGGNTNGADIDFNRLGVREWSIYDYNGTTPVFSITDNVLGRDMFNIYNANVYLNGTVAAGTQANPTDNLYDFGVPITNRWRTGYFGTSLAIGSNTIPTNSLEIHNVGAINGVSQQGVSLYEHTANIGIGAGANLYFFRSAGTQASPLPVSGVVAGEFFCGYDGVSYPTGSNCANIQVYSPSTLSSTNHGTSIQFFVIPVGDTNTGQLGVNAAVQFDSSGDVDIGYGNLLQLSDNTKDIGALGANRFRTAYFGTAVIAPVYQTTLSTPSSSSAACTAGQMWADVGFIYVCTATNTIKRTVLSSF